MSITPTSPNSTFARGKSAIGHYIIGKTIGEGTFGKVKLGVHILTGENVAVKVLEKNRILDVADVERVAREIHILKLIRHPHIVQLYEIIETHKQLYLIMEYASGGELFDYIVAKSRLREREAVKLFHQILDGVYKVHEMGVVHRDLKPENLLLDEKKNIKIVDFGLSNSFRKDQLLKTACGSPCYAAPEMISGRRYVPSLCDIWSCGVILFAMVSGYLPFEDKETARLYKKILGAQYQCPNDISSRVRELIAGILCTDPQRRMTARLIRQNPWYNGLIRTDKLSERPPDLQFLPGVGCEVPSCRRCQRWVKRAPDEHVESDVMVQLEKFGMSREYVLGCLRLNKHNHCTTTYYLLLEKKTRLVENLESSEEIREKFFAFDKIDIPIQQGTPIIYGQEEAFSPPSTATPLFNFLTPGATNLSAALPHFAWPQTAREASAKVAQKFIPHSVRTARQDPAQQMRTLFNTTPRTPPIQVGLRTPMSARVPAVVERLYPGKPPLSARIPNICHSDRPRSLPNTQASTHQASIGTRDPRVYSTLTMRPPMAASAPTPRHSYGTRVTRPCSTPTACPLSTAAVPTPRQAIGARNPRLFSTPTTRPLSAVSAPVPRLSITSRPSIGSSNLSPRGSPAGHMMPPPAGAAPVLGGTARTTSNRGNMVMHPQSTRYSPSVGTATTAKRLINVFWPPTSPRANNLSPRVPLTSRAPSSMSGARAQVAAPLTSRNSSKIAHQAFNSYCPTGKPPKYIFQELHRCLKLHNIQFLAQIDSTVKCQNHGLRFDVQICSERDVNVVRFKRIAGDVGSYRDTCRSLLNDMRI
eukprot:GEMP01002631.1.p1 GENE.GEMP01002631.1~~GEMP01002631.1.p1  ORF type:complete len:815 (-),score=126.14 GEMP01002631.1:1863-4307(-)